MIQFFERIFDWCDENPGKHAILLLILIVILFVVFI